ARRGASLRQACERRRGQGPHQGQCAELRDRPRPAQAGQGEGQAQAQGACQEEGQRRRSSGSRINLQLSKGRAEIPGPSFCVPAAKCALRVETGPWLAYGPGMEINILDAGIASRAGHHYDYGLKLLKHYSETGHDVHVYGASKMDDDVASDYKRYGGVTKLFRTHQYQVPRAYDWYAGEVVQYHRESASIADDLRSVRQADISIWPTIMAQ